MTENPSTPQPQASGEKQNPLTRILSTLKARFAKKS